MSANEEIIEKLKKIESKQDITNIIFLGFAILVAGATFVLNSRDNISMLISLIIFITGICFIFYGFILQIKKSSRNKGRKPKWDEHRAYIRYKSK